MSEDIISFCLDCGNLPPRCKCKYKSDVIPKLSKEFREKEAIEKILEYLPEKFLSEEISIVEGFRGIYNFFNTEKHVHCFCNNILDIKSGIIP